MSGPSALCAALGLDSAFVRRVREAAAPSGLRVESVQGTADARYARAELVLATCPPHRVADLGAVRGRVLCVPHGDADEAARAFADGADDVITPRTSAAEVAARLAAAFARIVAARRYDLLRREAARGDPDLVGKSSAFQRMRLIAESVAGTQVPVRIEGERGTGKTLVARRLHTLSARRDLPLLVLDAARTPPDGGVTALFGDDRSCGAVRAASGATLLVRSVQRLDARAQGALARWLRTGVVPEGPFAHEHSDARLLVTAHEPLDVLAAHGKFLADLAAALSTVVVRVPPLRERRGDAALLFAHFLQASGQEPPKLADDAAALFDRHPWGGNAEEVAALAALVAARGPIPSLDAAALRPLLAFPGHADGDGAGEAEDPASLEDVPTLAELTSGHVIRVLALAGGVRSRAAKALGISPRTLYNHLKGGAEATLPRTR